MRTLPNKYALVSPDDILSSQSSEAPQVQS